MRADELISSPLRGAVVPTLNTARQMEGGKPRRETLKIMLRVALTAWSLANIGSANAGEVERTLAASQFVQVPGVAAEAPVQNAVLATTAQIDRVIHPYVTA